LSLGNCGAGSDKRGTEQVGPLDLFVHIRKRASVHERSFDRHGVHGSVQPIQFGIFPEDFRVCDNKIGWILKVQLISVGDILRLMFHEFHNVLTILCG
jgi:hypothetical protein